MLERDRLIEIAVALFAVLAMIGVMLYIGTTYGGESGALDSDGGMALVAAIVGFIVLVTGVGVVLAFTMNEPGEEDADTDAETSSTV